MSDWGASGAERRCPLVGADCGAADYPHGLCTRCRDPAPRWEQDYKCGGWKVPIIVNWPLKPPSKPSCLGFSFYPAIGFTAPNHVPPETMSSRSALQLPT